MGDIGGDEVVLLVGGWVAGYVEVVGVIGVHVVVAPFGLGIC